MDSLNGEWREKWKGKEITAEDAIKKIIPGNRVFIGSGCSEPQLLTSELIKQSDKLIDTERIFLGIMRYSLEKLFARKSIKDKRIIRLSTQVKFLNYFYRVENTSMSPLYKLHPQILMDSVLLVLMLI